jgi:hypothetical protein
VLKVADGPPAEPMPYDHEEMKVTQGDWSDALSRMPIGNAASWNAVGVSRKRLVRLVAAGDLVRIHRGVYATKLILAKAEGDPSLAHAVRVAALSAASARKGVASHHSAARMHGLELLNPPGADVVTITVPPGSQPGWRGKAGVRCHAATVPDTHVLKLYGLPATSVARTVADIARASTFAEGVAVADSALRLGKTSKSEIRGVLASCKRWPGVEQARQVVDFATWVAESVLESWARVVFHEHGLPEPQLQVPIPGKSGVFAGRADMCWRGYWTIAEADGMGKYQTHDDLKDQYRRDRRLQDAGWEVVHFSWDELLKDPADVVARIRVAFARAVRRGARPRTRS